MLIGVTDSGMGGLTTLKCMVDRVGHDYLYMLDNVNCPYGEKSTVELKRILLKNAHTLISLGAEVIVLACNTLTANFVSDLRAVISIPVFGVEPAVASARAGERVLLLTTPSSARSLRVDVLLRASSADIIPVPCEGLADIIENDYPDLSGAMRYLENIIASDCDALILGCTHYCLLKQSLEEKYPTMRLLDGNEGLARHVARTLGGAYVPTEKITIYCTARNRKSNYNAFIKTNFGKGIEFSRIL